MDISMKIFRKSLKLLAFFVAVLLLNGFNSSVQANQLEKTSTLYANNLMNYGSSMADNLYWNNEYINKLQSQIAAKTQSGLKKNSMGERLIAAGLGLVMEFTTNNTYNELIVQ